MSNDVMKDLFYVFKESIEETKKDLEYFAEKTEMHKKLGEALNEYVKELNEMEIPGIGTQESEDLTKITNTQIEAINKFEKQIPLIGKTIRGANISEKERKKKILNNLKILKKEIKNIKSNMPMDINNLIQKVLKDSYDEMNEDLQNYAEKVQFYNEAKKNLREYVNDNREAISDFMEEGGDLTKISTKQIEIITNLEKHVSTIEKNSKNVKLPNKETKKEIVSDIRALKKDIKNKKVEIKVANPNIPAIKLTPIQKIKYLKRKNT